MSASTTKTPPVDCWSASSPVCGTLLALLGHTLWGSHPILSKALLDYLPPFVLLTSAHVLMLTFGLLLAYPHLTRRVWTRPSLWALALVTVARSITSILAVKYTMAVYVQLINLLAPFFVALFGARLFGEKPPPYTLAAMLTTSLGAALVLIGDPFKFDPKWSPTDPLGIGTALLSMLTLTFYLLLVRHNAHREGVHPWVLVAQASIALVIANGALSLVTGQAWSAWMAVPTRGWLLFIILVGLVLILGQYVQISALALANAAVVSSFMGWRLVVALLLGFVLLGEQFRSAWQFVGAAVVVVVVTLYLGQQARASRNAVQPPLPG